VKLINFYEVADKSGVIWGGASATTAVEWLRLGLDRSLSVSVWNEEDPEEPRLVTDKIDITDAVFSAILGEKER
jgi:hypothetical protein